MNNKNRYFQFLRGILIICVVFIHTMYKNTNPSINYINIGLRCLVNFCVAIFVFISAYFVKKIGENPKEYIFSRFKRLIIPLLIWNLLYFIFEIVTGTDIIRSIKNFAIFNSAAQLYYVIVLFQLVVLTPLILKYEVNIPLYQYWFFGWLIYYLIGLDKRNKKIMNTLLHN